MEADAVAIEPVELIPRRYCESGMLLQYGCGPSPADPRLPLRVGVYRLHDQVVVVRLKRQAW